MRYAIDDAVALWLAEEGLTPAGHQLVAPARLRPDVTAELYRRYRRGDLTRARALELHDRVTELRVRVLGDRVTRRVAFQLADAADAPEIGRLEYVAVARQQADALVTLDPALRAAAGGVVPLAAPGDLLD